MTSPIPIRPDRASLIRLATDAVTSDHTRRAYRRALTVYLAANPWPPDRATLNRYRTHLLESKSAATVNIALAAVRCLAREAAAHGLMDPGAADALAGVQGVKNEGIRAGNWLDVETARRLLALPGEAVSHENTKAAPSPEATRPAGYLLAIESDPSIHPEPGRVQRQRDRDHAAHVRVLRDRCLLALLLGGALRREEAASLTVEHIAVREGRTCIVDLVGKRRRVRTVPLPEWAAAMVREWVAVVVTGPLLRQVSRDGAIGERLSPAGVWWVVRQYAERLGVKLAPHDLRRTAATLAYKGGARVRSVQAMLGHSSVATTEMYLSSVDLLEDPAGDHMGLGD